MRHFKFTNDEYLKLSELTGVALMDLQKLDAMGLLHNIMAIKHVFRYEYNKCMRQQIASKQAILSAISQKYGVSVRVVKSILFSRNSKLYYCSQCNKEISQREYRKGHGLCFDCTVQDIKL